MMRANAPWRHRLAGLASLVVATPTIAWGQEAPFDRCPPGTFDPAADSLGLLCGTVTVFENRAAASWRTIDLFTVISPAQETPRQPPLFILSGGPGASSTAVAPLQAPFLRTLAGTRDIVYVDIRGTGHSGALHCPPLGDPDALQSLAYYLLPPEENAACVARLSSIADLTQYTTSIVADDLDEVRAALGYESFALWGASYGTRLALEILRRHPERVELVILEAVAPPGVYPPQGMARTLETARDSLVTGCARVAACREAFPDFSSDFELVLQRVRESPARASLENPATGLRENVGLEYGDFVMGLRFMLYSSDGAAALPATITAAAQGDFDPIMAEITGRVVGIRRAIAYGLFYAITCSENLPFVDVDAELSDAAGTMLGTHRLEREASNCRAWPRASIDPAFHEPVRSDAPVLILSGDRDPVTPPAYGSRVAATLSRAVHAVFRYRSHGIRDPEAFACVNPILRDFLRTATTDGLDVSCAGELAPIPFAPRMRE